MRSWISEVYLRTVFPPLLSDDVNPSDLSSLSDSLTLDDGKRPGIAMVTVHAFTPSSLIYCLSDSLFALSHFN